MERGGSLPYSQKPTMYAYHEPDESILNSSELACGHVVKHTTPRMTDRLSSLRIWHFPQFIMHIKAGHGHFLPIFFLFAVSFDPI